MIKYVKIDIGGILVIPRNENSPVDKDHVYYRA